MMTPAQMDDVFGALSGADEDGDAEALARICWQLFGELGEAHARAETLHARLADIAARAARASGPEHGSAPARPGRAWSGTCWRCPGCGEAGRNEPCLFCGQPHHPGCGYGLEYTPPTVDRPGQWRCANCRAIAADERHPAPAAS